MLKFESEKNNFTEIIDKKITDDSSSIKIMNSALKIFKNPFS